MLWLQNYLRVRGEYRIGTTRIVLVEELPPRARRIPAGQPIGTIGVGTTSACAENTTWFITQIGPTWNYLRVRGEYSPLLIDRIEHMELPPRARRIRTGRHG